MAPRSAMTLAIPVFFLVVAGLTSYPLSLRPAQVLPDNADGVVFAWTVSWVSHRLGNDPLSLFQANVFHPDTAPLAYGEPMVAEGLLAWPIWALTHNDAVTYNLLYVLTLALNATTMFLLAREVTGSKRASLLGGLVFSFTTANYDSAARLQIVSSFWTPLALFFLVRLVRRGRLRDGIGFGVSFALQGLACKYYELFFATLLAVSFPFFLWTASRWRPEQPPWRPLSAGVILAAGLLLPFDLVQHRHLQRINTERVVSQPATMASLRQALPDNWLYGRLVGLQEPRYDDRYFPGLVPLPLAALGVLASLPSTSRRLRLGMPKRRRRLALPFAVLGVAALLLAFGDTLPGGLPGPLRILSAILPGYSATRVPSRFLMFTRLSLALFVSLGAAALLRRCRPARVMTAALVLLLPLEHVSVPLPVWEVSTGARVPQVYLWLAGQHDAGPLFEFPPHPPRLRRWEAFWQHFSTLHWMPLVNGFSSYYPPHYEFVYAELLELPSARSLGVLDGLGVRYVVFHPKGAEWFEEGDRAVRRFEARVGDFSERLELVAAFDDAAVAYPDPVGRLGGERVYRVHPAKPPVGSSACETAALVAIPRLGWRCESAPTGDCALALDGNPQTAFAARQVRGQYLRVLFPRALRVRRVSLLSGVRSAGFARAPEVLGLREGRWERIAHRFEPVEFLAELLFCPPRGSMDFTFDPLQLQGLELRLGSGRSILGPWIVQEMEVFE